MTVLVKLVRNSEIESEITLMIGRSRARERYSYV